MMRDRSPVRVLYLEASTGGVIGGSLTGLQHLLRGLDRRRYEPIVVLYEEKALQAELAQLGIEVRILRKSRRARHHPFQGMEAYRRLRSRRVVGRLIHGLRELAIFLQETLPAAFALARIFREERPQLAHLCNGFRTNLDGIVAAWLRGVPCVCHAKGFERYGWPDRVFARSVALGICMTGAVRSHCERHGIRPKRMRVIYDGLDVEGFRPSLDSSVIRKELGISPEAPLVGIVGNIQWWKGQAVVVEAIREVRAILTDIRCLIVGGVHRNGADYARELHRVVEAHGLQRNVIFTGFREDVADLMGAMDIVIHASVSPEPFGRVILEAMALGKPVIATNLGGVPELVQDGVTGRLVSPGDPKTLAAAIVELLGDSARRERLGDNGRREVQCRFLVQRHVEEIGDAYARLGFGGPSTPMTSNPITSVEGIKGFYDDPAVVDSYLEKRMAQPLSAVLHERQVAFLKQAIARRPAMRVLDLAPGPARLSAELGPPGLAVAMDASLSMLREARRRTVARGPGWQLVQGDAYHLPFAAGSFDLVYSVRFIRRFDRPRRDALYAEIERVLRPGGFFIMDAQNRAVALPHRMARGLEGYPVYDELFLRHELVGELEDNGFQVSELEGMLRRFPLQFWLNRLRHWRLSGLARASIRALERAGDGSPSTWMVLCQKKTL